MEVISIAASNLVQLLKQISKEERETSKPCDVVIGTIKSVEPLNVAISQKMYLSEDFLIQTSYFAQLDVKKGDEVVLIRKQGGQQFLLIDKVVD